MNLLVQVWADFEQLMYPLQICMLTIQTKLCLLPPLLGPRIKRKKRKNEIEK